MKIRELICLALVLTCSWAWSTVYYVDATGGDDGAAGTSTGAAWQTFDNVNGGSFSGDDQILLKKGEVFRGTITVPSSGTSGHPIIFGAYGTGALPKILGSTAITTWTETEAGSHLWTAAHTWSDTLHMQADDSPVATENGPSALFIDGVRGIIDSTPDADGEWTFVDSTFTLYSVADPDTRVVELATRDCGIWTASGDNKDYITIQDIEIAYTGWCGILQGYESTNWTVQDCTVHHIGYEGTRDEHGINSRSDHMTISGCTVYQCGSNGINYSDDYGDYMVFTGNTVYDCHHAMINQLTSGGGADHCEISRNIVYLSAGFTSTQSGVCGIYFGQGGDTSTVCAYNLVYNTAGPGITIEADAITAVVENNTVYGGGTASIFTKTTHGLTLRNNIAVNIGGSSNYCYRDTTASDNTVDYNDWYSTGAADAYFLNKNDVPYAPTSGARTFATWKTDTSDDAHSIITNPAFTDAAARDFTLSASSGAKDTGTNLSYTTDLIGTAVPLNTTADMGAYEYTESVPPDAPTITGITDDTGTAGDGITNDQTLTFAGTAEANSTVTLYQDGVEVDTSTTDGSGDWAYDYSGTTIEEGDYVFTATATDPYGNTSDVSADFDVTIDLTDPTVTIEQGSTQVDPATALPILFDVTFSEPVTGLTYGDFTVGGTATITGGSLSGSSTDYVLHITTATAAGTVIPSLDASKCIDIAANNNDASDSTDNSVTYTITPTSDIIVALRALQADVTAIKAKTDNLPSAPAAVGSPMTLTSAYDSVNSAAIPVMINHSYGATASNPYPLASRTGSTAYGGVMITAYLKSQYDVGQYVSKGTALTNSAGLWNQPMSLVPGVYTLVYSGAGYAKVVTVTVQ